MAAAREHPNVAFQLRKKLDVYMLLVGGHKITERGHGVRGGPLGADFAKRVPGACGYDAVVGIQRSISGFEPPAATGALDIQHPSFFQLRACTLGSIEHHLVEIESRVNHDWPAQSHTDGAGPRRGKTGIV